MVALLLRQRSILALDKNAPVTRRPDPLAAFQPAGPPLVRGVLRRADRRAGEGLAADPRRAVDAAARADRLGQDARRVPRGDRPADVLAGAAEEGALPRPLRLAAEGARRRRRAQPARADRRHRGGRRARGRAASACPTVAIRSGDTPAGERARMRAHAARHPHHDARVALPAAHVAGARDPALGRDRHRRRDPLARRRASAARTCSSRSSGSRRCAPGSRPLQRDRPVGDAAAARRDRAAARRRRVRRQDAAPWKPRPVEIVDAGSRKALRPDGRGAGRGHGAPGRGPRDRRPDPPPDPAASALDLAVDPPAPGRAHPRAPLDDDLRQQPPAGRAAGRGAERDGGRGDRARAPRLDRAREAARDRGPAEARAAAGDRRDLVARARHRHGRRRSGDPDRGAAVGRVGHAADRPRGPLASARSRAASSSRSTGATCSRARPPRPACAEGEVEETCYPRNPLDVLAQQIVAIAAMDEIGVEELYALVRRAAPFAELPRASFEGVLDMLSGRYPSDEFAELRPRITWDRDRRHGARRARGRGASRSSTPARSPTAGSTASSSRGDDGSAAESRRVGELDEEMVFESRPGDVFLLGASSWRIEEITHDRVLVTPAPGRAGQDAVLARRPARAAARVRRARSASSRARSPPRSRARRGQAARRRTTASTARAAGEPRARTSSEQSEATGEVPSDRTIVVERFLDEIGDWRVCVLSPFGARVHAPWATAVLARTARKPRARRDSRSEMLWSDDGIVFRLPESDEPPGRRGLLSRRRTRSRSSSRAASAARRSSRRASARTRRARSSSRAATRGAAARCGRSGSARRTCSRSRRATARSRSCSRRTASACATCSTCRGSSRSSAGSRPGGSAS